MCLMQLFFNLRALYDSDSDPDFFIVENNDRDE